MPMVRKFWTAMLALLTLISYPATLPGGAQTPPPVRAASERAAADRKAELDAYFRRLKAAESEDQAAPLVAHIWEIWMNSGRPKVDELMQRAVIAMQLGEYDYALVQLDRMIAIAPDYAEGWNKRATVLYLKKDYDRSLADISETLKREPRHFGALSGRGMIHLARENWQGALEAYRAALAVNPFIEAGAELVGELERKVEGEKI